MHIYLLRWCGLHFHTPYVICLYVSTWSFFSLYFWFIPIDSWIFVPSDTSLILLDFIPKHFSNKGPYGQSYGFSCSHVLLDYTLDVTVGPSRRLSAEENSWESLGLQGDQTSQSERKSTLNTHWKDWCWNGNSSTLATWCEELTHWKRPWCWERLKAGGEGGDRAWDRWMASLTQWTWVWVSSRR